MINDIDQANNQDLKQILKEKITMEKLSKILSQTLIGAKQRKKTKRLVNPRKNLIIKKHKLLFKLLSKQINSIKLSIDLINLLV